jgi:hypothetical protein
MRSWAVHLIFVARNDAMAWSSRRLVTAGSSDRVPAQALSRSLTRPEWERSRIRAAMRDFRQERSINKNAGLEWSGVTDSDARRIQVFPLNFKKNSACDTSLFHDSCSIFTDSSLVV